VYCESHWKGVWRYPSLGKFPAEYVAREATVSPIVTPSIFAGIYPFITPEWRARKNVG